MTSQLYAQLGRQARPTRWQVRTITEPAQDDIHMPYTYRAAITSAANARRTADFLRTQKTFKGMGWLVNPTWAGYLHEYGMTPRKVAQSIDRALKQGARQVAFQTEGGGYPWSPIASPWD